MAKEGQPKTLRRIVLAGGALSLALTAGACSSEQESGPFFGYDATFQDCDPSGVPVYDIYTRNGLKKPSRFTTAEKLNEKDLRVQFEMIPPKEQRKENPARPWTIVDGERIPDTVRATFVTLEKTGEDDGGETYVSHYLDENGKRGDALIPFKCIKSVDNFGTELELKGDAFVKKEE